MDVTTLGVHGNETILDKEIGIVTDTEGLCMDGTPGDEIACACLEDIGEGEHVRGDGIIEHLGVEMEGVGEGVVVGVEADDGIV